MKGSHALPFSQDIQDVIACIRKNPKCLFYTNEHYEPSDSQWTQLG
jgi:hypothetical protein